MGDQPRVEVLIAQIARKQQRNMTRAQLIALGMSTTSIDRWVRIGRLYRSYPGVYSVGSPAVTPLERAMAAVLACGDGAALSHGSALTLWGIWKRWDTPFDVTITVDRRPKGVRVHRVANLERRDITRHYGIPVTTLARALLDQAPRMTAKSLARAVNDGRLSGHLGPAALADVVERYPTHRGSGKLQAVLGHAGDRPTRSGFEDTFPAFCDRYGLPIPEMNAIVGGYEVDALFREQKVIVELDGWAFHSSRGSFEDDRRKDADTLAADYPTVRITWERYQRHADREAARLKAILAHRMAA